MDMQASRTLAVTQQQAWDALNNPEVLKACIPGCDRFESSAQNQYAIGMALKIGPVAARFAGKVLLSEINPPNSYTLSFDGQGGTAGFGKGRAQVSLSSNGAGCDLAYSVHATVGGKVAQLGQRLVDGAAKSMAEDFFKRFDDEMQRRYPAPQAAQEAPAVAEDVAVPGGFRLPGWVWVVGALAIAALLWLLR